MVTVVLDVAEVEQADERERTVKANALEGDQSVSVVCYCTKLANWSLVRVTLSGDNRADEAIHHRLEGGRGGDGTYSDAHDFLGHLKRKNTAI